ncbi:MAG: ABC transporter permease [Gemmatimonadaceae bacterium]
MGKLVAVFRREYLERVRSKWFVVATLLGPLLFGGLMIGPAAMAMRTRVSSALGDVVILDATGTDLGRRAADALRRASPVPLADSLPLVRRIRADEVRAEEQRATADVVARRHAGYLVLDSATLGGTAARYAGRNATSLVEMGAIERIVRQALLSMRLEREGIDPSRVATLTAMKLDLQTEKISDKGIEKGSGKASLVFAYVLFMVLYFMIAFYGQSILRGVMEEKTSRVAEVVVSSVKPNTLLAGKVLGVGAVALTQVATWVAVAALLYLQRGAIFEAVGAGPAAGGMVLPAIPVGIAVALVLFFILGFIFYAALHAAVGAMVSNQEDVQQASLPIMLLLLSSVVFINVVLMNPGAPSARIFSLLPWSAPILMPMRMALIPLPWTEILASLASVLLGCLVVLWASAKIYRVGLLMYGKRPGWGEVIRWVRH